MSKEHIRSACDLLSTNSGQLSTSYSSKRSVPLSTKNAYSTNQIDIIDLTIDDDDDENMQEEVSIHVRSTTQIKAEPKEEPQLSAGGGVQRELLAYHAKNHSCAELHDLLETLSAKEREELARDVKVYKPGMKVRLLLFMHCIIYAHKLTEYRSHLRAPQKLKETNDAQF